MKHPLILLEFTLDNYDELTARKTVFIKFLTPW